jgi:pre-60S factor REI1
LDAFNIQVEKKINISEASTRSSSSSSDEEVSDNEDEQHASPFQCLFCSLSFASDDVGFATNLEHMLAAHGMSIPDQEMVVDMQSLVGYLAVEVRAWHECIYCGATKPSTLGIQSHMRDKGHCLLNLDREPELLDFWESPFDGEGGAALEQERPINLSATEIRFASGRVIGSRHATPAIKKASRKQALAMRALPPSSEEAESSLLTIAPQPASSRQLGRREEMSIVGVSAQQRQALVLAEKKAQRSEAVARRAREWVYAKAANSQKFDQADNQMKWGKQNHKLLPR